MKFVLLISIGSAPAKIMEHYMKPGEVNFCQIGFELICGCHP